jgi:hypothetical protein
MSARLGVSFGESDGGEITGKPGSCGDEEVVTDAVLVAVVVADVGTVIGTRGEPSEPLTELLTELGGLIVCVEASSEARGDRMEKERRLSLSAAISGKGILMLALSMLVIVWVERSWPAFRLGKSALLVSASKVWE